MANSSSVFFNPTSPLTFSTWLHSRSIFTSMDGFAPPGPQYSWYFVFSCFSLSLPNSCPVYRRMFDTPQRKGYTSFLVFNCLASCSCSSTSPVFISSSHLVPETPAVVPAPHVFPPCVVVRVVFHFNCLCGLPPFRASRYQSPHLAFHHRPIPWLSTCLRQSLLTEMTGLIFVHIFLATLAALVQ